MLNILLLKNLVSLITKYHNFFLGRIVFTGYDGSQNMLVSQPTFNTINIKQGNNECNVSAWNSKEIYNSELSQLHDFASVIIF